MRRNGFWTFCLSFIPGCAEMYWGFLKQGLSLLTIFSVIMFMGGMTGTDPLIILAFVAWTYSFFHARNMAHMTNEQLATERDRYLIPGIDDQELFGRLGGPLQKGIAWALILVGVVLILRGLTNHFMQFIPNFIRYALAETLDLLPQLLVAGLIIYMGIAMIRGQRPVDPRQMPELTLPPVEPVSPAPAQPVEQTVAQPLEQSTSSVPTQPEAQPMQPAPAPAQLKAQPVNAAPEIDTVKKEA